MKRILIADDHPATRRGVKHILSGAFIEAEFGEATDAAEVFTKVKESKWDIIILDMEMPGSDGLEICRKFKEEQIKIPVLLFSGQSESQTGIRAFKAGACGYLCKEAGDAELQKAVHGILSGRKYITPSLAELLATQLQYPDDKQPHELLSNREYQILLLVAKGKKYSEIAVLLSISKQTVATHRTRLLDKMGMKNNAELTTYAIRNNLV